MIEGGVRALNSVGNGGAKTAAHHQQPFFQMLAIKWKCFLVCQISSLFNSSRRAALDRAAAAAVEANEKMRCTLYTCWQNEYLEKWKCGAENNSIKWVANIFRRMRCVLARTLFPPRSRCCVSFSLSLALLLAVSVSPHCVYCHNRNYRNNRCFAHNAE